MKWTSLIVAICLMGFALSAHSLPGFIESHQEMASCCCGEDGACCGDEEDNSCHDDGTACSPICDCHQASQVLAFLVLSPVNPPSQEHMVEFPPVDFAYQFEFIPSFFQPPRFV